MAQKTLEHEACDYYFDIRELLCVDVPEIVENLFRNKPLSFDSVDRLKYIRDILVVLAANGKNDKMLEVFDSLKYRHQFFESDTEGDTSD